mmetsp:Transcript_7606/g.1033  ORF Transcript_7606/g.1033 Transcript_7606/m.1033 type:complete len:86 (+) Transcript_7606:1320-1577(+)
MTAYASVVTAVKSAPSLTTVILDLSGNKFADKSKLVPLDAANNKVATYVVDFSTNAPVITDTTWAVTHLASIKATVTSLTIRVGA